LVELIFSWKYIEISLQEPWKRRIYPLTSRISSPALLKTFEVVMIHRIEFLIRPCSKNAFITPFSSHPRARFAVFTIHTSRLTLRITPISISQEPLIIDCSFHTFLSPQRLTLRITPISISQEPLIIDCSFHTFLSPHLKFFTFQHRLDPWIR
jgi:hypothetical protein